MNLPKIRIPIGAGADPINVGVKEAGQIIVIFVLMLTVLIGLVGIAIDVTYAWRNGLQIQRAADAAAMAGVVYLPGDIATATVRADAIATSNGYTAGSGLTVTVNPNPANDRQLDVTITAPVQTFFVRLFGINQWTVTRQARAGYQLPVPMGSPEAFYGVNCLATPSNTTCAEKTAIAGANSTTVYTHGSWGAIQSTGAEHGYGDAYTPFGDCRWNGHGCTPSLGTNTYGGTNPDFDPTGYNYAVELPAGGDVYIFDPTACETGQTPSGSWFGTGDHWNAQGPLSVSTYYDLYNMTNSPLDYAAQPHVASSGDLFAQEYQTDQSGTYGTPPSMKDPSNDPVPVPLGDCREGKIKSPAIGGYWHDKWWKLNTSALVAGTYRVNIRSAALGAGNAGADFENDFSIEGVGSGAPRVYGLGRIVTYNVMPQPGTQVFYLAQIGPENAGKTMEIDLFDIGDIGGTGTLTIQSPDGSTGSTKYNDASFSYTGDPNCNISSIACSGSGVSSIEVKDSGGGNRFNDTWLTIRIKLPSNYGCSATAPTAPCLKPSGETQQGWWKISYKTSAGANDTTTWRVSLVGNPVHLVPIN